MGRSIEELNAAWETFQAEEQGLPPQEPGEQNEPKPTKEKKRFNPALDSDEGGYNIRHVENSGERSKIKENNFGKIDTQKYGAALDSAQQAVSKYYDRQIAKPTDDNHVSEADQKIYYTEVVERAIKMSQSPAKKETGKESISSGFILGTLADRLKRKHEESVSKEPGKKSNLEVSIYSAVGSDLEKDKKVVAIVECSTPDRLKTEKFYLLAKWYKRDIKNDNPEACKLWENFEDFGAPSLSIPVPYDGFEEKDLMMVLKNTLPKKICDDAAGKMLKNFTVQENPF